MKERAQDLNELFCQGLMRVTKELKAFTELM